MQRTLIFVLLLFCSVADAAVEDGATECSDGIDNDFDGVTDCAEAACIIHLRHVGCLQDQSRLALG
jgi:hypothetical protein